MILYDLQNTNLQILPTKTPAGNSLTDLTKKKKERKKERKKEVSKQFCKHLLGILVGFPSVV